MSVAVFVNHSPRSGLARSCMWSSSPSGRWYHFGLYQQGVSILFCPRPASVGDCLLLKILEHVIVWWIVWSALEHRGKAAVSVSKAGIVWSLEDRHCAGSLPLWSLVEWSSQTLTVISSRVQWVLGWKSKYYENLKCLVSSGVMMVYSGKFSLRKSFQLRLLRRAKEQGEGSSVAVKGSGSCRGPLF